MDGERRYHARIIPDVTRQQKLLSLSTTGASPNERLTMKTEEGSGIELIDQPDEEAPQSENSGTRLVPIADLETRETVPWLVKDLLPAVGVGRLIANSSAGKSYVALDLAKRVSRDNEHWFGHLIKRHGSVVAAEMEGVFDMG